MTRVTFSSEDGKLDISLPSFWGELTQPELEDTLRLKATVPAELLKTYLFARLTGMRVLRHDVDGWYCRFRIGRRMVVVKITLEEMAVMLKPLDFVDDPGDIPVRPDRLGKRRAVDASLHGIPFGVYLRIENLYQGYIMSKDADALVAIADLLYPGTRPLASLDDVQTLAVLQWLVQIKGLFARTFANLFQPSGSSEVTAGSMMRSMNNQIRALSGGDVAKEADVLAADCWRALTELDFKAKEAEDYRKMRAEIKK